MKSIFKDVSEIYSSSKRKAFNKKALRFNHDS